MKESTKQKIITMAKEWPVFHGSVSITCGIKATTADKYLEKLVKDGILKPYTPREDGLKRYTLSDEVSEQQDLTTFIVNILK